LAQLRRGSLRDAVAVLRPHRRVFHPYFRIDDPAPAVARIFSVVQKAASRKSLRSGIYARAGSPIAS
jgi:hypothetical protein